MTPDRAQAIVVLGARVLPDGSPSSTLRARVQRGVRLHLEGTAPLLVFSGGAVTHPMPEAVVARDLAKALGVPSDACLCEPESRSTRENAERTAALLRPRGIQRVLLVSDPFHLFRATRSFWREGLDAEPIPTDWEARGLGRLEHLLWTLRELPALLRDPGLLAVRRPGRG
jgi:uncharacterized SAM-binding protein YcdF (DUF218 family)